MKLRTSRIVPICLIFACASVLGGCGNSAIKISFPEGTVRSIDHGQSITITATTANDSGEGVTWTCTGAACTTLTGATTTQVTFTASGATGTATITATSVKQNTITGTVTITVNGLPAVSTTQAQVTAQGSGTAGSTYTFAFQCQGGSGTLTWSAIGLPVDGLSLNASTGVVSGTPTTQGTFHVTLTVTDSSAAGAETSSTVSITITVNNPPAPAITTTQAQVSGGTAGSAYAFTFHATGTGTLTWSAVGLSDGLSLNTSTGVVSGMPTSQAMVAFTLTASDTFGQSSPATGFVITVSASYTLTVMDLGTGSGKATDNLAQIACSDASGVVTGACSASYASGTMVALTAAASGTATFSGWGGACASFGSGATCTVTMSSALAVTADFVPPPAMQHVTFPAGTNPPAQQATFNCPSNTNPCTDPNAHALQLQIPQVGTGFTVTVMAVEVPPSQGVGLCGAGNTVLNDFDCRFATFFNYGTDAGGNTIVPLCYPYANGNCVHYEVYSGTPGTEPDPSLYSGGINWQIAWNNDTYVPPAPYTGSQPRLYDDPDYAPTPTSALGSICTQPMTINGVNQSYSCQFEFDITTFFNPTQPVDSGIGGRTKQLNDVVVGFPPATIGAGQLSASSTADASTVSAGSAIGFTINVSNAGPGTDNNVTLNDPLPSGAGVNWSIGPAYSGPGTCSIAGSVGSQVLSCAFGNLASGNNATLHVGSATAGAGTYTNAATVTVNNQQYLTITTITVLANAMSVAFTPALPSSSVAGSTISVNATVSNDPGSGGVDWTVTCGSAGACGSFTAPHTASGISTTYNAPANVPTGNTVTITATATDAPSPQASAVVTITPPPIQVTFSPAPPPNLVVSGTANLTANVANDGTNAGVDWTVTCGSVGACGAVSLPHTASGVATVYSAPPSMPTGQTVTITAKSTANPAQLVQATVWITNIGAGNCLGAPTGNESMLNGQYAFFAQGFSGTGTGSPHAYAGSIALDGHGNIVNLGGGVGGEVDLNDGSQTPSYTHFTVNVTGSSYTVGLDPTGSGDLACVVVSTSNGPATFQMALNAVYPAISSRGRIIKFDDTTGTGSRSSGILRLQDPTAFSTGDTTRLMSNYAFGLDGVDFTGGHFAIAGSFVLNPTTGAMSNVGWDGDDAGSLQTGVTGGTGSITSVSSTTGRAILQTTTSGQTSNDAIYIINANEFFIVETDAFSGGANSYAISSGRALATASSFSQSSLSGNYIIHVSGISGGNADVNIGLLTLSGGTVNGTAYEYAAGSPQPPDTISGSYLVSSPSGRVPLSNTGVGQNPPVLYLVAPPTDGISAFIVGTDSTAIFGVAEASSGTFTTSGLAGNYFFGTEDPGDNTVTDQDGVVAIASSGSCNGTQNNSGQSGLSTGAISGCAFAITNSNGTGNAGGTNSVAITNGTKIFFYDEGGTQTSPAQIRVLERQ